MLHICLLLSTLLFGTSRRSRDNICWNINIILSSRWKRDGSLEHTYYRIFRSVFDYICTSRCIRHMKIFILVTLTIHPFPSPGFLFSTCRCRSATGGLDKRDVGARLTPRPAALAGSAASRTPHSPRPCLNDVYSSTLEVYAAHPWLTNLTWLIVSRARLTVGFYVRRSRRILLAGNDRETTHIGPVLPRGPAGIFADKHARALPPREINSLWEPRSRVLVKSSLKAPVILHCPLDRMEVCDAYCNNVLFSVFFCEKWWKHVLSN